MEAVCTWDQSFLWIEENNSSLIFRLIVTPENQKELWSLFFLRFSNYRSGVFRNIQLTDESVSELHNIKLFWIVLPKNKGQKLPRFPCLITLLYFYNGKSRLKSICHESFLLFAICSMMWLFCFTIGNFMHVVQDNCWHCFVTYLCVCVYTYILCVCMYVILEIKSMLLGLTS